MRKITLMAALLGTAYFANAQVGIGTPTPATSAMLDITADEKGVLIPRVNLSELTVFAPITGTQQNGLLVFATGKKYTSATDKTLINSDVTTGFYYWDVNKWERIVNQTQLDQVISNQADIAKIKALLDSAYGSNNLGINPTTGTHGGMVYTPAVGTEGQTGYVAPKFEYVKWNSTTNSYDKLDATAGLISLIQGNETKTKIVNIGGNTYYISESFEETEPTTAAQFETFANNATSGIYKIDFVSGVTQNFNQISTTVTNILKPNSTTEYFTVEEYIKFLSSNTNTVGDLKIVFDASTTPQASFQQWNGTAWVAVNNSAFSTIVTDNETETKITKNSTGTAVAGDIKIDYKYFNEAQPLTTGTPNQIIDVQADLKTLIEGNTEIKNAIQNILNAGGSVYYTETKIEPDDNNGTLVPAKTLYVIKNVNGNDVKTPIDISGTVITAITNNSETVKNILGDNFKTTTIVKTGDVWTDGKAVYKGVFDAFIKNGTANVVKLQADTDYSEISISGTVGQIISITVLDGTGNKLTSSVTDVVATTTGVKFRIGTGNMYNVVYSGTGTTAIKVLIEYSAGDVVTP